MRIFRNTFSIAGVFRLLPAQRPPANRRRGLLPAALRLAALCLGLLPLSALAASSLDILDRERDRARTAPQSRPGIVIAEDGQGPTPDDAVSVTLASLTVRGATAFPAADLLAPYRQLVNTRVSFAALKGIAADLTKKYRDAGYLLSRVILPAQEVDRDGAHIQLTAVEGFISSVEYGGDERLLERFTAYFAASEKSLVGKTPLKHSDFERQMLLLQDLPGIRASSRFREGPVSGSSVLVLDIQGDLLDGSASWGNTGTDSAGPGILSVSGGVNALPFIGSRTALSWTQADNVREYWSLQASESWQAANGLSLKGTYALSESPRADTEFARLFDYETQSRTFTLGIAYPLLRGRDMNLRLGLTFEHRNSDAFLLDSRYTRDRLRTLSANADFDFSDALGGVTQIIPTLSRGLKIFAATDKDSDAANTLAPAEFWKLDLYVSRNQQLPYNFSLFAAAEAQFADESLSSYNKFSLGGSQFGRGFDPGVMEGDNAFAVSLEPRWTWRPTDATAVQPFAFIDWGTVWTAKSVAGAPDEEHASSFGGGLRFWGHVGDARLPDFTLSAFVAQPMQRSSRHRESMTPRFAFQASLFF
jgi:hemolysin activation/secretion protein